MSATNILKLIENISRYSDNDMSKVLVIPKTNPSATNRANSVGDALEFFIRDSFCNSYTITDGTKKSKVYSSFFSYLGNQNNPPDIMIMGGDAFEIKKAKNPFTAPTLNGVLPKDKLHAEDARITNACRNCEKTPWKMKDIFYVFGNVKKGVLRHIIFVHGACYAMDPKIYDNFVWDTKVKKNGVTVKLSSRIQKTKNTLKMFQNLLKLNDETKLQIIVIMKKEKYFSYPLTDRKRLENLSNKSISITDVMIPDPAKSNGYINAELINCSI